MQRANTVFAQQYHFSSSIDQHAVVEEDEVGGRGRGEKATTTSGPTAAEVNAANIIIARCSGSTSKRSTSGEKDFVPNYKLCDKPGHWLQDCTLLEKAKRAIGTVAAVNVDAPRAPKGGPVIIAKAIAITVNLAGITSAMTSSLIMHDSGVSHGIFHNRDLLTNIRKIADYAEIRGMGGAPYEVGDFMNLSTVYIVIVYVLSNSLMSDHGINIEYDNAAQTCTVRNPSKSPS